MHIQFSQSRPQSARLVAQVTDKGKLPEGLEKALAEGAESARFKGKAGQLFEGFVERDGQVLRLALAGAGDRNDEARLANCEKAGAALAAKYQSIGNAELVLDLAGSSLDEPIGDKIEGAGWWQRLGSRSVNEHFAATNLDAMTVDHTTRVDLSNAAPRKH